MSNEEIKLLPDFRERLSSKKNEFRTANNGTEPVQSDIGRMIYELIENYREQHEFEFKPLIRNEET